MTNALRRPFTVLVLCGGLLIGSTSVGYALWQTTATASGQVSTAAAPSAPIVTCEGVNGELWLAWSVASDVTHIEFSKGMSAPVLLPAADGRVQVMQAADYHLRSGLSENGWFSAVTDVSVNNGGGGLGCGTTP